jgi:phage gp46-like protein
MSDNELKNFRITYQDSSKFTYNTSEIRVADNEARLRGFIPNCTFYCTYTSSVNANYAEGSPTGIPFGDAKILGGELDLTSCSNSGVEYSALLNVSEITQIATVRFRYTPNYSGAPLCGDQPIFDIRDSSSNKNIFALTHISATLGYIVLQVWDYTASPIINGPFTYTSWLPTAGQQYEFGLNVDVTNGVTKLYIDNVQYGSTLTATGIREGANSFIVGNTKYKNAFSNFKLEDFIIYNTIEDLSQTYSLPESGYFSGSSSIVLNSCLEDSNFIKFSTFTETMGVSSSGSIGYQLSNDNVNWYYWDGSKWTTAGSNTNTVAEVNEYIKLFNLDANKKFNVKVFLIGSGLPVSIVLNTISYFANTTPERNYIDLKLTKDSDGIYDINIADNGDFELVDDFSTAIDMSILTDKRADDSQQQIPKYRRGWWGNIANNVQGYEIGSLLWLLNQTRLTEDIKNDAKDFALDSLQWFLDEVYLKDIQAEVTRTARNELTLAITLVRYDNQIDKRFYNLWENINN